jgi:hypothetical protein
MDTVEKTLQEIIDEVADRVKNSDLSLEDLNLAAVILLNVKARQEMETSVLSGRD